VQVQSTHDISMVPAELHGHNFFKISGPLNLAKLALLFPAMGTGIRFIVNLSYYTVQYCICKFCYYVYLVNAWILYLQCTECSEAVVSVPVYT
jgi:hypothetical protein